MMSDLTKPSLFHQFMGVMKMYFDTQEDYIRFWRINEHKLEVER